MGKGNIPEQGVDWGDFRSSTFWDTTPDKDTTPEVLTELTESLALALVVSDIRDVLTQWGLPDKTDEQIEAFLK